MLPKCFWNTMDTCDDFTSITDSMMKPSSYTSSIKFWGRTILPPVLTAESRKEMADYRHQAVLAETRLLRRKLEKKNLVNKVQAVVDRIEKFHPSTCSSYPVVPIICWEENQKITTVPNSVAVLEILKNEKCTNLVENIHIDEIDISSVDLDQVEKLVGGETNTNEGTRHRRSMSSDFNFQTNGELDKEGAGDTVPFSHLSCPEYYFPETKSRSLSDISNNSYPFSPANSEDNDTDQVDTIHPVVINDFCQLPSVDTCDNFAQDQCSSPDQRTSEFEDGECNSTGTVIPRINNDNASLDETDTESIPASVAQSTDLEKYMDSSADMTSSSRGQSDNCKETSTECSNCPSSVSDALSSRTLIASEAQSLSHEDLSNSSSSTSPRERKRNLSLMLDSNGENKKIHISKCYKVREGAIKGHVRRSSYTLDQPSLALIRAHEGCSCHGSPISEKVFPHTSPIEYNDNVNIIVQTESQELFHSQHEIDESTKTNSENSEILLTSGQGSAEEVTPSLAERDESELPGLSVLSFTEKQIAVLEEKQKQLKNYLKELAEASVPRHKSKFTKSASLNSFQEPFEESVSELDREAGFKSLAGTIFVGGKGDYHEPLVEKASNFSSMKASEEINANLSSYLPPDIINEPSKEKDNFISNVHQRLQEYHEQQIKAMIEEQRQQWKQLQEEMEQQLCHQLDTVKLVGGYPHVTTNNGDIARISSATNTEPQKVPVFISPEALHPSLKPKFDKLSAAVKGYLTRRLMKTDRVQSIILTIKDTLECAVKLHQETPIRNGTVNERDVQLHQRLISQLTASCYELHDIFFTSSTKERMAIIAKSRNLLIEKKQKDSSSSLSQSSVPRLLSAATLKAIERKRAKSSLAINSASTALNCARTKRSPIRPGSKGFSQRRTIVAVDRPRTAPPSFNSNKNPYLMYKAQKSVHKTEPSTKMNSKKPYRNVRRALYMEKPQEGTAHKKSN